MSDKRKRGRQIESLDTIEDAVGALCKSGLNFILLVGTHENVSTIYSGLNDESIEMLRRWNNDGTLKKDIELHLDSINDGEHD